MHSCLVLAKVALHLQCFVEVVVLVVVMLCLQLFVPLLSPHVANASAAAAEQAGPWGQQQHHAAGVFSLLEEVALRQAGGLTGQDIDRGIGQPLEQLGVSLTFGECSVCLVRCMCRVSCHPVLCCLYSKTACVQTQQPIIVCLSWATHF